ncbi:MAG: glycine cleavage system protein GcvH [Balneola sp.]|nr:glycine cleavage system protein GcvH [Balneola sp.]MBO6651191.1 glycine cleavage system protein GcvH [Balneola sp.]MBO6710380.1 glycine cleavage system protein GcvH [Balneola sp.]MBO6799065.1 glycine cleavage system protein GcvH [Balneola sp.]MBO6870905.1 glycine cleavage system protein GcvH [Balneola sp.]
MSVPSDLKYTREHEWIKDNGDGTATIGITEFAQGELGDIVFVELEEEGFEFSADDTFGTVEAVKTVSELYAPVDGEISEINEELEDNPEIVNEDPYEKGWMVKIKLSDTSQLESLLSADQYKEIIA